MEHINQVKWPQLMRSPFRDPNKYYVFHKDTCHWAKDYKHFKWEIDHLLSEGHLEGLVYGNRDPR